MKARDLIDALKAATPEELEEIRRLLGRASRWVPVDFGVGPTLSAPLPDPPRPESPPEVTA
jgi:hypothetical protein